MTDILAKQKIDMPVYAIARGSANGTN